MAAYSPFLSCGVGGRVASLYALLTGFHAPDHPSMRFGAARLRGARTARLAVVFACCGVSWCAVGVIVVLFRSRSALTRVFAVGVDGSGERELCADGWNCEVRVR